MTLAELGQPEEARVLLAESADVSDPCMALHESPAPSSARDLVQRVVEVFEAGALTHPSQGFAAEAALARPGARASSARGEWLARAFLGTGNGVCSLF